MTTFRNEDSKALWGIQKFWITWTSKLSEFSQMNLAHKYRNPDKSATANISSNNFDSKPFVLYLRLRTKSCMSLSMELSAAGFGWLCHIRLFSLFVPRALGTFDGNRCILCSKRGEIVWNFAVAALAPQSEVFCYRSFLLLTLESRDLSIYFSET